MSRGFKCSGGFKCFFGYFGCSEAISKLLTLGYEAGREAGREAE